MEFTIRDKFDSDLLDSIKEKAKGQSKQCVFNAINHLEMAYKIKDIDPNMAYFRAITAEEEMASAIFLILKEHQYNNAKKLKHLNHSYKQGLDYFILSVIDFFVNQTLDEQYPFKNKLSLLFNDKTKLIELYIYFKNKPVKAEVIPPLNFSMKINEQPYRYENEFKKFASLENVQKLKKAIDAKANTRNKLLYASSNGIIKIKEGAIEKIIDKQYTIVFKFIRIYGLIYPYKNEKSEFVQDSLDAFLFMMRDIDMTDNDKDR